MAKRSIRRYRNSFATSTARLPLPVLAAPIAVQLSSLDAGRVILRLLIVASPCSGFRVPTADRRGCLILHSTSGRRPRLQSPPGRRSGLRSDLVVERVPAPDSPSPLSDQPSVAWALSSKRPLTSDPLPPFQISPSQFLTPNPNFQLPTLKYPTSTHRLIHPRPI
jgi:hypothetical protein